MVRTGSIRRVLPLSSAQAALWIAQALDPSSPILNQGQYLEVFGPVDRAVFDATVRRAVADTDAFQLRFVESESGPSQYVDPYEGWTVPFFDVSETPDPDATALEWMHADMGRADDLRSGPLFTFALFRVGAGRSLCYFRGHHIFIDGVGAAMFTRRVAANYTAFAAGLEPPPDDFGSCLELLFAEQDYRSSERFVRDRAYWIRQLEDRAQPVTLSGVPPQRCRSFLRSVATVAAPVLRALRAAGAVRGASWPQVLTAVAVTYLARRTGADDVCVGIPVTGRIGPRLRRAIGMVVNVLPLRVRIVPRAAFGDILDAVARGMRDLLRHQMYRGEDLRHDLGLRPQETDVYGTLVNVVQFDYRLTFGGYATREHNLSNGPVDDLAIVAYDVPDAEDVQLFFNANPDHYSIGALAAHQQRFCSLLAQLAERPDARLRDLDVLDASERALIVRAAGSPGSAPSAPPITSLLAQQARKTPEAVALRCGDRTLTYGQLHGKTNQVAHSLAAAGVGPESRVAIAMTRSLDMVVALLGVLKAGAAYVPVDPAQPENRRSRILADARPVLVVSDLQDLPLERYPTTDACAIVPPASAAYVLYTSGSTGQPKGVVVHHGALSTFLDAIDQVIQLESRGRHLAITTIGFDISILELLAPLCRGGEVILATADEARDPARIAALIRQHHVSSLQATPSHWQLLLEHDPTCIEGQRVLVGGEALPVPIARRLHTLGREVWNLYGPTEATVWATAQQISRNDIDGVAEGIVRIGRPLPGYGAYILDATLNFCPPCVTGELYLAGSGIARGYFGQPGRSSERFVADPYGPRGARMYRTGDLVSLRENGTLEYLGRSDDQVKIRGFRVELGEVEAACSEFEPVQQAVVLARDSSGGRQLAAFIVPKRGARFEPADIRKRLSAVLPDYMVPSAYIPVDRLPLTAHGKIDRAALLTRVIPSSVSTGRPPDSATERLVADAWRSVLGVDHIGADDNFFDLGGHSVLMTRVLMDLRKRASADISILHLFEHPTVAATARFLDSGAAGRTPEAEVQERVARRAQALKRRAAARLQPGVES